jgi:glycosyltransferase involved in cell wall biosynthesis
VGSLKNTPLVSVIIPAYNAEAFISKTIDSVVHQTYQNLEIIVVDDGSSDRTAELVLDKAQKDQRIRLLQQNNAGVAAARNSGIKTSQGQFIAPLDADDIWLPTHLEKQVDCFLQSSPSVGLVYSWSFDIDEQDQPTGALHASRIEGKVYPTLLCHNFLSHASSALIRRDCLRRVGVYNCQFKDQNAQGCEDWDFYLRIADQYEFRVVPEFLVGYRKLDRSMSRNLAAMARSQALMLQAVQQKHPEIPGSFYRLSASSFHIYLARQAQQQYNYQSTLFWVSRAFQVEPLTLFRADLYWLIIASYLKLVFKLLPSLLKTAIRSTRFWQKVTDQRQKQKVIPLDANSQPTALLKSCLEMVLHHFLSTVIFVAARREAFRNSSLSIVNTKGCS